LWWQSKKGDDDDGRLRRRTDVTADKSVVREREGVQLSEWNVVTGDVCVCNYYGG
jgi:hypothetical protein